MLTLRLTLGILTLGCLCLACEGKTDDDGVAAVGGKSAAGGSSNVGGGATVIGGASQGGNGAGGATGTVATDCQMHSDCVLRSVSCCGSCGAPTATDMIALSADAATAYATQACGTEPVGCPACAAQLNPDLLATCDNGTCRAIDLVASDVSTCSTKSDCVVRAAACCECGASTELWNLVAVAATAVADYAALVCEPTQACAECMPVYPTNAPVDCVGGHCVLTR